MSPFNLNGCFPEYRKDFLIYTIPYFCTEVPTTFSFPLYPVRVLCFEIYLDLTIC